MSFYVTGGTLGPTARSYVERHADRHLLDALLQGEFCYVLTSRQMGKSSLMVRTANRLAALGVKVATLDLTAIGAQDLTPEQFYFGLLDQLSEAVGFRESLESFWEVNNQLAPLQRFMNALREVILPSLCSDAPFAATPTRVRMVIFLDEIDLVRSLPFSADAFFAAIRECYNRRAQDPAYEHLVFCLLGVTTPTDLIRDARQTPFNIGRRVELNDFTSDEAEPLVPGLVTPNVNADIARILIERILYWTGGHPYLTQRLCQETADRLRTNDILQRPEASSISQRVNQLIDGLCSELFLSNRALKRDSNLNFVSEHLLRCEADRSSLLHLYGKVRQHSRVPDDELDGLANQLRLAGIVRASHGRLLVRNRIYARAFDREWVRANMPEAALRREREAFRRGVLLAAAVSLLVVSVIGGLTVFSLVVRNGAKLDSARASYAQALVHRTSGRSGQRVESLTALYLALKNYPNRAQLRDEAAATLSLMDLQPVAGWPRDRIRRVTAVSPDLAVAAQVEADGSVSFFHPLRRTPLGKLQKLSPPPQRLRFSPRGDVLLVEQIPGSDKRVSVWNWAQRRELTPPLSVSLEGRAVDFTADGEKLAVGAPDGTITIYFLRSGGRQELTPQLATGGLRAPQVVRFNPSGELLAESCSYEPTVQIWRVADGMPLGEAIFHPAAVHDLAWGDGGRLLGVACGDETVRVWRTNNLAEPYRILRGHSGDVLQVAFSHAGDLVASVGKDQTVRLWSLADERQLVFRETEPMEEINFSANDRHLIGTSADQMHIDLLEVLGGEYVNFRGEAGAFEVRNTLDFSAAGHQLLANFTGRLAVYDLSALRETLQLDVVKAHGAYFTPDGHVLEISDKGMFKYPIPSGHPAQQLHSGLADLTGMALSLDRRHCVVVRRDQVLAFDMASISLVRSNVLEKHYDFLALHPRDPWLACMAEENRRLDVWNLARQPPRIEFSLKSDNEHFAFDPSGRWLIVSQSGGFKLIEVGGWNEGPRQHGQRHTAPPGPLAVNSTGTMVAVASARNLVELWTLPQKKNGREPELIVRLDVRNHPQTLAFSPDGTWLGAITKDAKGPLIELWHLKRLWAGLMPYLEPGFRFPEMKMN